MADLSHTSRQGDEARDVCVEASFLLQRLDLSSSPFRATMLALPCIDIFAILVAKSKAF